MRILVSGSNGFVGRVVVKTLLAYGYELRLALRSAHSVPSRDFVIVGDIGPSTDWDRALEGVDAVVHLAGRAHVMRDHSDGPAEFRRVNSEGTLRLARAALTAGARRFVFVSTIKVNGESTSARPFRADDAPAATDPYSLSKLEAESALRQIAGLEPVIIRPPLVYGPGAKGNLWRLCQLALSGIPVPLASINNRRDLVGVDNLADLIVRCLTHAAAPGEVFLVSDGEPVSTPGLYRAICAALGRPARMFRFPVAALRAVATPVGMSAEIDRLTQSMELDITKTRELLQWGPPVSVADGIAEMARAFRTAAR